MRKYKFGIFILLILLLPSSILSKEEFDSNEVVLVYELLQNIVEFEERKITKHFKFPLKDKELLETFQLKVDSISYYEFVAYYDKFFPLKFRDLIKTLISEKKYFKEGIYIELPDIEEKECKKVVSITKNNCNNLIELYIGTNYNRENTFNLEEDYFCDEYSLLYFFEIINNKLVYKEFHMAD